jgi:oligopeptide transport system permease protein
MLMILAIIGVSVPGFILAGILQYFFSFKLGWAPASGWGESPWQVILPALALGAFPLAFLSRLIRASMSRALESDYLRTARAKGLRPAVVLFKHGLRNAILPAISYCGPLLASLLTGSFVVESIFGIAGLGDAFVTSINDRDYTVIMGVTIFYSALLIGFNVLADILYRLIDPRISRAEPVPR